MPGLSRPTTVCAISAASKDRKGSVVTSIGGNLLLAFSAIKSTTC